MAKKPEGQRNVILAIDGSESADNAFEWYLKHLRQPNDYVYGLVCPEYNLSGVSVLQLVGPLADVNALSSEFNQQHQIVQKLCSDYTARLRSCNVKGQVDAMSGDKPGVMICDQASKLDADCIVMGTRGLSKFKKFILGSVSQYVLNHAEVPVSVIPMKPKPQEHK